MRFPLKDKYINLLTEIANFSPVEQEGYQESLKYYRDLNNVVDTSWQEGKQEGVQEGLEMGLVRGREEGVRQVAEQMKTAGIAIAQIAAITGLPIEDIEQL